MRTLWLVELRVDGEWIPVKKLFARLAEAKDWLEVNGMLGLAQKNRITKWRKA